MSLIVTKKHSIANDLLEGQHLFDVADSSASTVPIYRISVLKNSDGKLIPVVYDTRTSENPNKQYIAKGGDYATALGLPADFIALCVATGTNAVVNPAGTGQVCIAKANMTTIGDSTITTDVMVSAVTGQTGGTGTGTGGTGTGGTGTGGTGTGGTGTGGTGTGGSGTGGTSGTDGTGDDTSKLSTGAKVGIGAGIVVLLVGIWAAMTGKFTKKD